MKEINKNKLLLALIPLILAFLSVFVVGRFAASAEFHQHSIQYLDEKKGTVLELAAASTAVSAAITLLPGDTATPIADKLADLGFWFVLVLCAIYLEKYLLTITAFATFYVLIPGACLLYITNMFLSWDVARAIARKMLVFGIAIVLVIPVSVKISTLIEDTYQSTIDSTIEQAKQTTQEVRSKTEAAEEKGEEGFLSGIVSKVTGGISNAISEITDKVGRVANNFMEALAIMLVTSCVIPILVLMFFIWLINITFGANIPTNYASKLPGSKSAFRAGKS